MEKQIIFQSLSGRLINWNKVNAEFSREIEFFIEILLCDWNMFYVYVEEKFS